MPRSSIERRGARHLINVQRVARRRADACFDYMLGRAMDADFDSCAADEDCGRRSTEGK